MSVFRALRVLFFAALTGLVLALGYVSLAHAGFFYGKQQFYTIKTEHFSIHFAEGLGPMAEDVKVLAEEAYTNITTRLEWKPKGRTQLVLTDKNDQANGLATVLPYNAILLYMAYPDGDSTLDNYKDYLKLLINHEFTHIAHIDMHYRFMDPLRLFGKVGAPNGSTPTWMREGMAVYEESQLDAGFGRNNAAYSDMLLRTAILNNTFPRIDQIAGSTDHFPAGNGPYHFGSKFIEWLNITYGEDRMYKYQKEIAGAAWPLGLNNKARRVYGKSFYQLWDEYKAAMQVKYSAEKEQISAQGLTEFTPVVVSANTQRYYTPNPAGDGYAYYDASLDEASRIIIKRNSGAVVDPPKKKAAKVGTPADIKEIKRVLFGQMSFSKTGRYLAFSSLSSVEPKTSRSEIYYYDLQKSQLMRASDAAHKDLSLRATDPDFSPADGGQRWLVMVRNFLNTDQLYIFDLLERTGYIITSEPKNTQFFSPRFSPDGQSIVVSRRDPVTGFRDIAIYSKTGNLIKQITNDIQPDAHPVFSPDGAKIYYDSYHTGVSNIFAYDIKSGEHHQMTNVLDGVFQPMPSKDGGEIYVQRYVGEKNTIQKFTPNASSYWLNYKIEDKKKTAFKNGIASGRNYSVVYDKTKPDEPLLVEHTVMPTTITGESRPDVSQIPTPQATRDGAGDSAEYNLPDLNLPDGDVLPVDARDDNGVNHTAHTEDAVGLAIARFSLDPADATLLPDEVSGDSIIWGKKGKGKTTEATKVTTTPAPAATEYASAYKDILQDKPQDLSFDLTNPPGTKKYHAFPEIIKPSYVMPNLLFFENAVLFGATAAKHDPLYRHSWSAFANYRSDAQFIGAGGTYVFSRYDPTYYVGALRYAVDWGDINGTHFFEERDQAYAGMSFVLDKKHKFNVAYFYEWREALVPLTVTLTNMAPYAGFRFQYSLSKFDKFSDSISPENGYQIKIAGEWTNTLLGSDGVNEERVVRGDVRYYFEMPWSNHHVLGFRVAGGWAWGDVQQFGVYRLGGPFGEGVGASYSSRLFPLRGLAGITYGGDRVFIFSAEYRYPLIENVNRGLGTTPFFLDKLAINFFCDGGDIKYRTEAPDLFTRMLVSVGAELSGDFVVGYGLPVKMRTGYAVILTNRSRLGALEDVTTGASLKYGSIYLQLGTMF